MLLTYEVVVIVSLQATTRSNYIPLDSLYYQMAEWVPIASEYLGSF